MNEQVVTRYPLPVRISSVLICLLLAIGTARSHAHWTTIAVAFGAGCLTVAVLAYRAEINGTEIRIRYAPFYTRHTPIRDVVCLIEGKTLIFVTAVSRIPIWGLSDQAREALFDVLPRHLDVASSQGARQDDSLASVRKHRRRTILAGVGFLATAMLSIPFAKGNSLHGYWNSVGQYELLLCLLFFIAFVLEAGFTWVLWSTKRDIDTIESHPVRRRH